MLRIAICDDQLEIVEALQKKVQSFLRKTNEVVEIRTYTQSRNLRYDIEESIHFDIVLSDIEMPDMDGMELGAFIRSHLPNAYIMFITSHSKYVYDSFALNVFRYIPKQELDDRLVTALNDALKLINIQKDQFYVIQLPQRLEKVPLRNIMYITRDNKKNSVMTMQDTTEVKVRKSLAQIHKEIGTSDFLFVDRGLIVNVIHIKSLKQNEMIMDDEQVFQISRTKINDAKTELAKYWSRLI